MKITISKIPGDFPATYSEQFYFDGRAVKNGIDLFTVETAKKVQVYGDTSYEKRKIQTVVYDKYEMKFITTESVDIDKIFYAGLVYVSLDNGEQHSIKLIEQPTFEKLASSEFREYTLNYRNLSSKTTINHLVYSSVNTDYYMSLVYNGGIKYTQVYPDFGNTEWETSSNKDNYSLKINSEYSYKTIIGTFYLPIAEVQPLVSVLNYENTIAGIQNSANAVTYLQVGTTKYIPLEVPEVKIEDSELEGIVAVNITIKYEQTLNYPFA